MPIIYGFTIKNLSIVRNILTGKDLFDIKYKHCFNSGNIKSFWVTVSKLSKRTFEA